MAEQAKVRTAPTVAASGLPPPLPSKLRPPPARPGLVERTSVLDRLAAAEPWAVLAVVAGAGYGKSTVLRQWTEHQAAATAWLTLDADDNDTTVLLGDLARALDSVVDVDPAILGDLATGYPAVASIARSLACSFGDAGDPLVLVIDDLHSVVNPACLDVVDLLVQQATATTRLGLGSRHDIGSSVPRLRAGGMLAEIGSAELAMSPREASALASGVGVHLSSEEASDLVAATEGWPAALYLAARSMSARPQEERRLLDAVRGRPVGEYVHAELLASLDAETVRFLTRSSVLEQMSGASCDEVLHTFGSGERLRALTASNLLVVPLDDEGTWFRYHQLFRDLLRTDLGQREPSLVPELHRRAARWYASHGMLDESVEHAMEAGDAEFAAGIAGDRSLILYRTGRLTTMERWFTWFERTGTLEDHPEVAAAGGWTAALLGHPATAEARLAAAERARSRDRLLDGGGDVVDGRIALLRAVLWREGLEQALEDAEHAERLVPTGDPWRSALLVVAGLVSLGVGRTIEAERSWTAAEERAAAVGARPAQSVALAELALLALDRGEGRQAWTFASRSLEVVERSGLEQHATSGIVFAVAARLARRHAGPEQARRLSLAAHRVRPQLNHALPHVAVQTRVQLARTLVALGEAAGARMLRREIDEILRLRPGLGRFEDEAVQLRELLEDLPPGAVGISTLTTAELRLLPMLRTHRSFREIGERLFVSHNTVKTQAISIYRKLGASSRSDAVERAIEIGLLEQ